MSRLHTIEGSGCRALLAGAVMLALTSDASAKRAEFSISTVSVITSSGHARILLDPGDISVLDGELVTSAFLELPMPGQTPQEDVEIVIFALDRAWVNESPTWTTPWTEPGGDLDAAYAHTRRIGGGRAATSLSIDVTPMVRDMADGEAAKNGFLLTVPLNEREGFDADERTVLGTLSQAKLRVTYQGISAFGYEDGSNSTLR